MEIGSTPAADFPAKEPFTLKKGEPTMLQSFSIPSTDGKNELACYRTDCAAPRALLQIAHGMCEYFLRYEEFAQFLSERGILVFGHDHLGHGSTARSDKRP